MSFTSITEYISTQPVEIQSVLEAVRKTIRAAAPKAEERISWRMPTFWQGENIVHFAAFKSHIGLYPGGEAVGVFADRLKEYKTSKGSIRFLYNLPIDHGLIADIVRWRITQAESGKPIFSEPVKRESYETPDYITAALDNSDLWERYNARPPYQRNDYIGWITRAKRKETQQKRLTQMLDELKMGDSYMGMAYKNYKGKLKND